MSQCQVIKRPALNYYYYGLVVVAVVVVVVVVATDSELGDVSSLKSASGCAKEIRHWISSITQY